ncbi:MAG: phage tail protein [Sphingobacterium sp.]|nr:phage tail protein [Sphingobacterium sp.]
MRNADRLWGSHTGIGRYTVSIESSPLDNPWTCPKRQIPFLAEGLGVSFWSRRRVVCPEWIC